MNLIGQIIDCVFLNTTVQIPMTDETPEALPDITAVETVPTPQPGDLTQQYLRAMQRLQEQVADLDALRLPPEAARQAWPIAATEPYPVPCRDRDFRTTHDSVIISTEKGDITISLRDGAVTLDPEVEPLAAGEAFWNAVESMHRPPSIKAPYTEEQLWGPIQPLTGVRWEGGLLVRDIPQDVPPVEVARVNPEWRNPNL